MLGRPVPEATRSRSRCPVTLRTRPPAGRGTDGHRRRDAALRNRSAPTSHSAGTSGPLPACRTYGGGEPHRTGEDGMRWGARSRRRLGGRGTGAPREGDGGPRWARWPPPSRCCSSPDVTVPAEATRPRAPPPRSARASWAFGERYRAGDDDSKSPTCHASTTWRWDGVRWQEVPHVPRQEIGIHPFPTMGGDRRRRGRVRPGRHAAVGVRAPPPHDRRGRRRGSGRGGPADHRRTARIRLDRGVRGGRSGRSTAPPRARCAGTAVRCVPNRRSGSA